MAAITFMVTCAVAEGFLVYVLTQFERELRKARGRVATAMISVSCATGKETSSGLEFGEVIEIRYGSRVALHANSRRMAS